VAILFLISISNL
jgi:hypothetical protein